MNLIPNQKRQMKEKQSRAALSSTDLFGARLHRPRQPRRVLMQMVDAGPGFPNWGRFECAKCGEQKEKHDATDSDLRRGIPCETCTQPNK